MKMSLTRKITFGVGTALLLIIGSAGLSYYMFRQQAVIEYWVRHTYEVLNQAETIQKMLVDMETGRRGFRSTNEKRFLQPYYEGIEKIHPAIEGLKKLTQDNVRQTQKAEFIEKNINDLLIYWRSLGEDASKYSKADIVRVMDEEKRRMDIIRNSLDAFVQVERIALEDRQKENERAIQRAMFVLALTIILVLLLAFVLTRIIFGELNNRNRAEDLLKENLDELDQINRSANEKNWLLTGISSINDAIQGVDELAVLSRTTLEAILQYTGLPAGLLYCYDEEGHLLKKQASIGASDLAPETFRIDEGLVGRAAAGRTLLAIKNIPSDYWTIQSGAGKSVPKEVILVPLWHNKTLKGVIELASFEVDGTAIQDLDLLKNVANNIAVAINSVESHERVMRLLVQVQDQRETLENQQEELRQSNDELTRQAEILQASEEELKVQEEELRQINAELEEKNEAVEMARQELDLKAQELEVTSKYKSEFLANMSHELRTPLNSVLILAKLLSENKAANLTAKQVEYATIIHKSGSNLLELINDILDLSKIEAGKIDFTFENIPVNAVANNMEQLFRVLAEEKSVQFVTNMNSMGAVELHTDRLRLEQIIRNLLSNAFKFTPKGGTVTLDFQAVPKNLPFTSNQLLNAENVLAISVKDTGIGISPDKQRLIFEAFQQADGSVSRKYGGTGLGLSISKELAKKLNGELQVQSEEGEGSTFTLYVPIHSTMVDVPRVVETPVITQTLSQPVVEQTTLADDRQNLQKGDKTLLIIEDDPLFAGIVRDFARTKGYKTILAIQGDEGLYCARKYQPSAIILDMQLPVIDGWNLLKILKSDPDLKNIPVHIMSADEPQGALGGALAFVRKPLAVEDLEKAFSLLGGHLQTNVKRVLVLSGVYLKNQTLQRFIDERKFDMQCDYVASAAEAVSKLQQEKYDCIIADIGADLTAGTQDLQKVKEATKAAEVPIIIYLDKNLSTTDELQLKKISDVIIRESSLSKDRLMDELELFLYKVQEVQQQPFSKPVLSSLTNDKNLKGKKILLVDDDMRNVFALSTLLEEHEITVITAGDGKEALEQLDEQTGIDLVLMDIMMPEMDGYEATRRIRANSRFHSLPVIALTAKAMTGDREKCIEAGASDYITKPIDSSRLLSLLRVWLSK
ncbi:response regulator [Tellurirhabdus bombi]|uniref:response regulator n=1 Tax=Tellurirhabdus bombi TaxID=2907205 RepID=UPI001F280A5B|nr:response regulator [Tellurirhabdus bombi]